MECILFPEQYKLIFKISFLTLGSCIYAMYSGYSWLSICPGGIFLTSVNYWRKPDYSWRQSLDIAYVNLAISYQIFKAYNAEYMVLYYALNLLAMCFYPLGFYFYKKKQYWRSTYAHCALHIIANISCVVLYSGKIM